MGCFRHEYNELYTVTKCSLSRVVLKWEFQGSFQSTTVKLCEKVQGTYGFNIKHNVAHFVWL